MTENAVFNQPKPVKEEPKHTEAKSDQITIEEFAKIDLRVAKVLAVEKVEGSDKLLKLRISVAGAERQIVAGIAQHYSAEQMVGKEIVVVANLKPAKLRGLLSEGMLLAASNEEGKLAVIRPDTEIGEGAKVK